MQGRRVDSSRRGQPRLPVIAPRQEASSSTSESEVGRAAALGSPSQESARSRLPPRSRSGCWTCRNRKVKCDERRPLCGQCARLSHNCVHSDYNPRLAFKDDTPRVLERMQEVTTTGSSVWDPQVPAPNYGRTDSQEDLLPAFSALTTDEEREKKAQLQEAGTYIVIANPESFANLPEYSENEFAKVSGARSSPASETHPFDWISQRRASSSVGVSNPADPNTVILKTFEDASGPVVSQIASARSMSQVSLNLTSDSWSHIAGAVPRSPSTVANARFEEARSGGRDFYLLQHYRSHISPRVIRVGIRDEEEDVFELQAQNFPPLFHAMMAISALSLAHRSGKQSADALDHYQQVLPAMRITVKSEQDSISDGALFTHYLLFLYEIASAGPWESNLWQSHGNTLQRIITRRLEVNGTEPHGFLVWIITMADLHALLSGSGDGVFVEFVMKNRYVHPSHCLPPLKPDDNQRFFPEEMLYFSKMLELNQEVVWLATEVGLLAKDLRFESAQRQSGGPEQSGHYDYRTECKSRLDRLQALCHEAPLIWQTRYPDLWSWQSSSTQMPWRVRGFWDHIYSLYRVCVIYAHSCMYVGQTTDFPPGNAAQISTYVADIIKLASEIVVEQRWECQFITLCLFFAGVNSKVPMEKMSAIESMTALEKESYGENTATMRQLMAAIYDRQVATAAEGHQHIYVDWMEEMRMRGLRLVMWGM